MARTQGSSSDITGPRIRAAAQRLFARHGYAAVSMRQIAAEVGVQAGALYNYTPDKQSLLFDLMSEHMRELMAAWDQTAQRDADPSKTAVKALADTALGPVSGPAAALERFIRFHIRYNLERPDAVFIAYMELRNLTAENFQRIEALRRAYEDELEGILMQGVRAGVFAVPDTKITTLAVIAMLNGVLNWYRAGGRLSLEQVEEVHWDMVRKAVSP